MEPDAELQRLLDIMDRRLGYVWPRYDNGPNAHGYEAEHAGSFDAGRIAVLCEYTTRTDLVVLARRRLHDWDKLMRSRHDGDDYDETEE